MSIDTDKLEDRTAVILGQIQASVAEYVRAMNEAGALRRREVDEAQRQQDEAIKLLKAIQLRASSIADENSKLAAKLGSDWLGMVERGLRETAFEQAKSAARISVAEIDQRLSDLSVAIRDSLVKVSQISEKYERISRSLAWKTIGITGLWLFVILVVSKAFLA